MLKTVVTWWATQMLGWLPARADDGRDTLVAEALPGHRLRLVLRRRGTEADLGTFAPDAAGQAGLRAAGSRRPTLLRLPTGSVLERLVELPAAAERSLRDVLAFEMDRLTPFPADTVHWTWTLLRRDKARKQVAVGLHLVPRARIANVVATLAGAGMGPNAVEVGGQWGTVRIPLGHSLDAARRQRRINQGLAAAIVLLGLAAAVLPFVAQAGRAARAEARIAALGPPVAEAQDLRRRLAGGGADAIEAERMKVGNPLQILAALTDALPDDTFLTELTLRGGQLGVSGQSRSAVRLVAALAANPLFRNPAFSAPVTRAEPRPGDTDRRDLFSLRVDTGSAPASGTGR